MALDWGKAKMCVDASAGAYFSGNDVLRYIKPYLYNASDYREFDREGAQALCYRTSDCEYVVAFRGTEPGSEFSDVLADLKTWHTDSTTTGDVHAGFKEYLDKIYPDIVKWLEHYSILEQQKKVYITGHSLGAAMATICVTRLKDAGYNVCLYTFGSPRVGDHEWAKQFENIEAYRFVNNNDIVCRVPPAFWFKHVGELHYVNYHGDFVDNYTGWGRAWDRLKSRLRALAKFEVFDGTYDHPAKYYKERIYEHIQRNKSHSKS